MLHKSLISLLFFFILFSSVFAQPFRSSLTANSKLEYISFHSDSFIHSTVKPILISELLSSKDDGLIKLNLNSDSSSTSLKIRIDPIVNLSYGKDINSKTSLQTFGGGILVRSSYTEKLAIQWSYEAYKLEPTLNAQDYYARLHVLPQWSNTSTSNGKSFTAQNFRGHISYTPIKAINLQLGKDVNFIGEGYRSLLLSDFSGPYPFFKISATKSRFKYDFLLTGFDNLYQTKGLFLKKDKHGVFHTLSFCVTKKINITLFEGVIWQGEDTLGNHRGIDFNYLNPVIVFRPVEFSQDSPDNSVLGANLSIKAFKKALFYSQLMIDDFSFAKTKKGSGFFQDKYGYQLGLKAFLSANFIVRAEFNSVRPYTYAHKHPLNNYTHLNQPLAHPLGANFNEYLFSINYNYKRIYLELITTYARLGSDTGNSHFGSNLFKSDYSVNLVGFSNTTGQGVKTNLFTGLCSVNYLIHAPSQIFLFIQYSGRIYNTEFLKTNNNYFSFGIRSNLSNTYENY